MKIVIAPDSFKGSMSSIGIIKTMSKVIEKEIKDVEIEAVPIADGGEGTIEALVVATGGTFLPKQVTDPLGRVVDSHYGLVGLNAIIEMANCSGLTMINTQERDPMVTTSYGTGEMIRHVIKDGFQSLVIGIGGSATNDGGTGAMEALGAKFLDKNGQVISGMCGKKLIDVHSINTDAMDHRRIKKCDISVMCDVNNPLTGENGATYVYGPQKGASKEDLDLLEAGMKHYQSVLEAHFGEGFASLPGAGAAGGIGAALVAFLGAKLVSGIDEVLKLTEFDQKIQDADLIITGEGRVDSQSACGKVVHGITDLANNAGKPVIVIAGGLGDGAEAVYDLGVKAIMTLPNKPMSLETCMAETKTLLEQTTKNMCGLIQLSL